MKTKFNVGEEFFKDIDENKYYYAEYIGSNEIHIRDEVSLDEYELIVNSNSILTDYYYFVLKKMEIDLNLQDFEKSISEKREKAGASDKLFFADVETEVFVDINRTFTNYALSCRIFIDHLERYLKHNYKEDSKEYKLFAESKKYCYDENFSYRLLYHLRNYIAHKYFPIDYILAERLIDKFDSNHIVNIQLTIAFDKYKLLQDEEILKKLGKELELMDDLILVRPTISNYAKSINYLLDTLIVIEKEKYINSIKKLTEYQNKNLENGIIQIVHFVRTNYGFQLKGTNLKTEIIKTVITHINELEK